MALIDKETIRAEIERRMNELEADWSGTPAAGWAFSEILSFLDTLQEPAKRSYNNCNGCEYNRTLKDQIGWQFRGCFGGDYKGKPIAEIELCPLKVDALQEPEVPKEICPRCIHYGEYCYQPGGGMQYKINENGVYDRTHFNEKEQSANDDLEKEIARYLCEECSADDEPSTSDIARHFYELGCTRTAVMYDDIEYERQRAEEAELSEGFDAEMDKYFESMEVQEHENIFEDTFHKIARHFAEWGAEHLKR